MEPSLTVIILISASIFGVGIKYLFHKCDEDEMNQVMIRIDQDEEIPPLYQDDNPPPYSLYNKNKIINESNFINQNINQNQNQNMNNFYNGD